MSDRIDEYHGADAKVLTTDEVERWQEFLGDGIQLRRILATTRALETAVAELDSARFARDRYANTIGLIESAIGFSGASPVEETIERVRRLKAERDSAITRAEEAALAKAKGAAS